jgi:hypothetical protein
LKDPIAPESNKQKQVDEKPGRNDGQKQTAEKVPSPKIGKPHDGNSQRDNDEMHKDFKKTVHNGSPLFI